MSVMIASGNLPCLSQLHLTNSHVCLTCAYKPACLIHLHTTSIHMCIAISNHLCCPLHLHQTSIVVMFVAIALYRQACILQLHPTGSQDGNEHICSKQISYSGVVYCVDTLHSISRYKCSIFSLFLLILSIFQADFFHILIQKRFVL